MFGDKLVRDLLMPSCYRKRTLPLVFHESRFPLALAFLCIAKRGTHILFLYAV